MGSVVESGMKTIPLTQGRVAIVDDIDFDILSRVKWGYSSCGYAMRSIGRLKRSYMHREISCAGPGQIVDHINGDPLDNRRGNLRLGDKCLNSVNRGPASNNTSGHRGVSFDRSRGKWCARLKVYGRERYLGRFNTIEEAIAARRDAEAHYFAAFKVLGS